MTNKTKEKQEGQLDKALDEMEASDRKDKNIFRVDADTFRFMDIEYKLIEDYKEAFDIEMMEERFTDYLLKYDYIVGDIAYEKLRLRGFYEDYRKGVPIDMKISNLEDYLIEYCNFGCQYFVFERVEKNEADPDSYFKRNKKSNKRSNRRNNQKGRNKSSNRSQKYQKKNQKKDETSKKRTQSKNTQKKEQASQQNKKFEIRKKKED